MIDAVALPDVMRDRPARDHDHTDDHLHVLRLVVAAVTVLRQALRPSALEIGAGDVIEHEVRFETEEITQAVVERDFDTALGGAELVERGIPAVELAVVHAHPPPLVPVGDETPALAIAHEVGLEPAGEPVLAGRSNEPVGDEHEGTIGKRHALGAAEMLIEDVPEAQLVEQGAHDEHRPPGRGLADVELGRIARLDLAFSGEEPAQLGQHFEQNVLTSQIGDDALLDLATFTVGLDDADIFVDGAAGGADFDGPGVHGSSAAGGSD